MHGQFYFTFPHAPSLAALPTHLASQCCLRRRIIRSETVSACVPNHRLRLVTCGCSDSGLAHTSECVHQRPIFALKSENFRRTRAFSGSNAVVSLWKMRPKEKKDDDHGKAQRITERKNLLDRKKCQNFLFFPFIWCRQELENRIAQQKWAGPLHIRIRLYFEMVAARQTKITAESEENFFPVY